MTASHSAAADAKSMSIGFEGTLSDFAKRDPQSVLGDLSSTAALNFAHLAARQTKAWKTQIEVLQSTVATLQTRNPASRQWRIVLEYDIPRRGKRIDAVIISDTAVFVLEFKVGNRDYTSADRRQVEDYALELKDFHERSTSSLVIPILVSTEAMTSTNFPQLTSVNAIPDVVCVNGKGLAEAIQCLHQNAKALNAATDPTAWALSRYQPTPTIIEAARHLYANHEVASITHTDAEAAQLDQTREAIEQCVARAQTENRRLICFVSGVPGAGKTLVGLNAAVALKRKDLAGKAVYLSGNGPLVKVLQESLARDQKLRLGCKKEDAARQAGQFVQNVHRFINHYLERSHESPDSHVVVFDEAQRAWSKEHAQRKFQRSESEPASMIGIMNRRTDWAVIVALIGSGQEINTGEAGLVEWLRTIDESFPDWHVHLADPLENDAFTELCRRSPDRVAVNSALHLRTSKRSYRGTQLALWVEHVLAGNADEAADCVKKLNQFPIVITRSLDSARSWLRTQARGQRRMGLVASSGAQRLRRFGVDVGSRVDVAHWFLGEHGDVRSSYALEQAATEFDIQGLELDWVGLCWGGDFRWNGSHWEHLKFRGTQWQQIRQEDARNYLVNKYRVLLTRAREGMVIWLPTGHPEDTTAPKRFYDPTASFLATCGVTQIDTV